MTTDTENKTVEAIIEKLRRDESITPDEAIIYARHAIKQERKATHKILLELAKSFE